MAEFENEESNINFISGKKHITPFRVILLIAVISIIGNAWFFGNKWLISERTKTFQQGLEQGRQEVNAAIIQQLQQLYDAGQSIQIQNGEKTIIFIPQK